MSATKTQSRTKKVNKKPAELILQRVVFPEDADFDTLPSLRRSWTSAAGH